MNISSQRGFTLIELSIVLIITGIMLVGAIQAYTIYNEKRKIEQMNSLMVDLDQYIKEFPNMIDPSTVDPATGIGTAYGRFPCPASMDGTSSGNDFNVEDCSAATISGVNPDGSTGGTPVLVGKIPASSLGISSDFMKDAYGNYLVYAVTQNATDSASYGKSFGALQVIEEGIDRDITSGTYGEIITLSTHNGVQFLIASMGDTNAGAYAFNGTQPIACPDSAVKEHENCDGDATFISSLRHDENDENFYDDQLAFLANSISTIEDDSDTSCEQEESFENEGNSCPDGWEKLEGYNGGGKAKTGYLNIDAESGDYYFTNFETPMTVAGSRRSATAPHDGGMFALPSPPPTVTCLKSPSNNTQTKCFNKNITATINSRQGHLPPASYDDAKRKCPSGWHVIDIQRASSSYERDRSDEGTNTITTYSNKVLCGN